MSHYLCHRTQCYSSSTTVALPVPAMSKEGTGQGRAGQIYNASMKMLAAIDVRAPLLQYMYHIPSRDLRQRIWVSCILRVLHSPCRVQALSQMSIWLSHAPLPGSAHVKSVCAWRQLLQPKAHNKLNMWRLESTGSQIQLQRLQSCRLDLTVISFTELGDDIQNKSRGVPGT